MDYIIKWCPGPRGRMIEANSRYWVIWKTQIIPKNALPASREASCSCSASSLATFWPSRGPKSLVMLAIGMHLESAVFPGDQWRLPSGWQRRIQKLRGWRLVDPKKKFLLPLNDFKHYFPRRPTSWLSAPTFFSSQIAVVRKSFSSVRERGRTRFGTIDIANWEWRMAAKYLVYSTPRRVRSSSNYVSLTSKLPKPSIFKSR